MREVATGVWHWESPHPDWAGPENEALRRRLAATAETPSEAARGVVSSYAIEDDQRLLLFDPLTVPHEIEELAAGRDQTVVLTCPWHERDTRNLVERRGVPLFTPRHDEGTPTWPGSWAATGATRASPRPASGCPSEPRRC